MPSRDFAIPATPRGEGTVRKHAPRSVKKALRGESPGVKEVLEEGDI